MFFSQSERCSFLTAEFLIRAIWAVVVAITDFLCRQTDGGVAGTHVVGELTHQRFAVFLIWVVLAVAVAVTNPSLADAASCGYKVGLKLKTKTLHSPTWHLCSESAPPESLQPNLTAGSHMGVTPSQFFSSLMSMQSVSPSQRQRSGMHRPSIRHWNSSVWQPPGGRVAVGEQKVCFHWWAQNKVQNHEAEKQQEHWLKQNMFKSVCSFSCCFGKKLNDDHAVQIMGFYLHELVKQNKLLKVFMLFSHDKMEDESWAKRGEKKGCTLFKKKVKMTNMQMSK